MDKVLESVIDLLLLYDQRRGGMSINESRERFGGSRGWSAISRTHLEEMLVLMEEDGYRLLVQQRYDD